MDHLLHASRDQRGIVMGNHFSLCGLMWFNAGTGATYKALEFWTPIKSNSFIIDWGGE